MEIKRISPIAIEIDAFIWHQIRTRKAHQCSDCLKPYTRGAKMYRPSEKAPFRDERLCLDCIARLEKPLSLDTPISDL